MVVVAASLASAAELSLSRAEYVDRAHAIWAGQIIAVLVGMPFEHKVASVLPLETLPSAALAFRPTSNGGRALAGLAAALRRLPIPVIGRIANDALLLDLRCLEDEAAFLASLAALDPEVGDAVA